MRFPKCVAAILLGLLLWAQPASAQNRVQTLRYGGGGNVCGGGTCTSGNFASSVTSGNAVIVFARQGVACDDISAATDTLGTTYTRRAAATTLDPNVAVFTGVLASSGTNAITVTLAGCSGPNSFYFWLYAIEVSGLSATPFDTAVANTGTGTTDLTSSTFSTAQAAEYVACAASQNNLATYTAGTNFTLLDGGLPSDAEKFGGVEEYITSGTLSSYTAHITSGATNQYAMVCVALKASGGGGGGATSHPWFYRMLGGAMSVLLSTGNIGAMSFEGGAVIGLSGAAVAIFLLARLAGAADDVWTSYDHAREAAERAQLQQLVQQYRRPPPAQTARDRVLTHLREVETVRLKSRES